MTFHLFKVFLVLSICVFHIGANALENTLSIQDVTNGFPELDAEEKSVFSKVDQLPTSGKPLSDRNKCPDHICYVLDGSEFLNKQDYRNARNFIWRHAFNIGKSESVWVSAVQCGNSIDVLSYPTTTLSSFKTTMKETTKEENESAFLAAGLAYCMRSVIKSGGRKNSAVVYVGSGQSTVGASILSRVVRAAGSIRIIAIGVGKKKDLKTLRMISNYQKRNLYLLDTKARWKSVLKATETMGKRMCKK